MKKLLILIIAIFLYAIDLDFDGIPDNKDYCPRTPLLAVVNKEGCKVGKVLPFNSNIEIGYQYFFRYKIPLIYFKDSIFFKTYSLSLYLSKVKTNSSFKSYNNNLSFSKSFYNSLFYFKPSIFYYFDTYYQDKTYSIKFSFYFPKNEFLFFYKLKKAKTSDKRDINTVFFEKIIKTPKLIILPFLYIENTEYKTEKFYYKKYFGSFFIFKLHSIYLKPSFIIDDKLKNKIFSFSIGTNF